MKKPNKTFAWLALGIILCSSQLSLFGVNGKGSGKTVPKSSTSNFVSTRSESSKGVSKTSELTDGLYLVLSETKSQEGLAPLKTDERLLVNDYEFLLPEERGEKSYVVVSKNSFVPIILSGEPIKSADQSGKPKLEISLAEDQIQPLEKFTRENVMKSVAIVVGGKIVTMHKIRVPIVGGKMQITRCTDHGCEALYTQLQKRF